MSKQRRRHNPAFNAKLALEAVEGEETATQPAARYEVHPGQIQVWKRGLTEGFVACSAKVRSSRPGATLPRSSSCARRSTKWGIVIATTPYVFSRTIAH